MEVGIGSASYISPFLFSLGGHKIFKGFRHHMKKMMKNFADKMTPNPSEGFGNLMERHQKMMKKFQKKFFKGKQ